MAIHILQLGPYPPPEGGVSRNMLAIRDELVRRGDKCSIIATSKSTSITNEPDIYHPGSAPEMLRLLSSIKFDVLHLHVGGDINRRVIALALAATMFAGKKSVLTMHSGAYPLTEEARGAKPTSIRGMIFRRFGRIVSVNDAMIDVFERFGVDASMIRKILPFSLQLPDKSVAVPEQIANFFAARSPVLLSVGGLEKDYDPIFQIEAMGDILKDHPNAGLLLVGDGSMRSDVESAVAKTNYRDSIFVAGNIDHSVTLNLIEKAAILLRTTLFDGDAISVREALFLGTPVIATDNRMRPDGTHLIEIGDRDALLGKVKMILEEEAQEAVARPSDTSNIGMITALYEELIQAT